LLGALVLILAPPAHAGWRIDRARAVAAEVWNDPCASRVRVEWGIPLADYGARAWSYVEPDCVVGFSIIEHLPWMHFCTAMVHEYGHLAGYTHPVGVLQEDGTRDHTHSPYSDSVMFPELPRVWVEGLIVAGDRRCRERGRPYLRGRSAA